LLMVHQLPSRASNARVKTWRRLQQVGALPTRNAVYVLPNRDSCREDFEWIRAEIVALGGEATLFAASTIGGDGDAAIVKGFRAAREADYRALIEQVARRRRQRPPSPRSKRDQIATEARQLRERIQAIEQIDFFEAPGREEALAAVAKLEALGTKQTKPADRDARALSVRDFQGRRWLTRPRPGVDRMASAWLIRRFIDRDAKFGFGEREGASDVPFDMYEGEFSHHGGKCTFEVLVDRFGLGTPVVAWIGEIVHDLDMKDQRHDRPEAAAIGPMIEGLRRMHGDDATLLSEGVAMFEALARGFESDPDRSARPARKKRR
jgi:hypothetical protein